MIQSAEKYPVSDLFGIDKDVKYIVPKYQREYVWKRANWEKLFDDVIDNPKGHFLGSIITVNKNTDALAIAELELIDGQQRFTTIALLYAAIYFVLVFETEDENKNDELKTEIINLKYRIIQKSNKDFLKVDPSYQNYNYNDYMAVLNELELRNNVDEIRNLRNRRIYRTYQYFYDRLMDVDHSGKRIFNNNDIINILNKLNSSIIVKIEVNSHADAFTLFETINNTGVKLTAIDLIKNNLLSQYEKKSYGTIDEAFNSWVKIIDNLPDEESSQERFLRQYYNAFKHKKEFKIEKIGKATGSNLIYIYDELIKRDVNVIVKDLLKKSQIYGDLISADNDNYSEEIIRLLQDLDRIGGAPAYSLLLYIFSEFENDEALKIGILELLVKYFVRRNLTDTPPTRDLDNIFIGLIELVNSKKKNIQFKDIRKYLVGDNGFASDKEFKEKLTGDIYEENTAVARFVLVKIEEMNNKTKEIYTDMWARDSSDKFIWTIEHIFPQGENVPKSWVDMIAGGDKELACQYRESHVHKLGNLTITGYNSKLSNFSFQDKLLRKDRKGNFVGFKNGLFLNKDLTGKKKWTIEDINSRTETLISIALEIFKI